jgi:hypothetical protein
VRQDSGAPRILVCPCPQGLRVTELHGVHVERVVRQGLVNARVRDATGAAAAGPSELPPAPWASGGLLEQARARFPAPTVDAFIERYRASETA